MVPNANGTEWHGIVPNGTEWHQMVPNGAAWYRMVLNGAEWYRMVPNGAELCRMVPNGAEWCRMVPNGAEWCIFFLLPTGQTVWSISWPSPCSHKRLILFSFQELFYFILYNINIILCLCQANIYYLSILF